MASSAKVTVEIEFKNKRALDALTRAIRIVDRMPWTREREKLERYLRRAANGIKVRT